MEVILLIWLLLQSLCICTVNNATLSFPHPPTHAFEQLPLLDYSSYKARGGEKNVL